MSESNLPVPLTILGVLSLLWSVLSLVGGRLLRSHSERLKKIEADNNERMAKIEAENKANADAANRALWAARFWRSRWQ